MSSPSGDFFHPSPAPKRQLIYSAVALSSVFLTAFIFFRARVFSDGYMPHALCYLEKPSLIWTHVIADTLIGMSLRSHRGLFGVHGIYGAPRHSIALGVSCFRPFHSGLRRNSLRGDCDGLGTGLRLLCGGQNRDCRSVGVYSDRAPIYRTAGHCPGLRGKSL